MLQAEEKEGLLELLKENYNEPVPEVKKEPFFEPNTEFSLDELPESPFKRMLQSQDTNEYVDSMLNDTESALSRFRQVSTSFSTGATILVNLPKRTDLVLYNKQLIKGLRYIFNAFSSN
jgi:hypothetical protein